MATSSHGGIVTHEVSDKDTGLTEDVQLPSKYATPIVHIGIGSSAVVCEATNSETGEKVAIKKILGAFRNTEYAEKTLREVKILCQLDHENVIAVKDIIRYPQKDDLYDAYTVFELMETDLDKIIKRQELPDDRIPHLLTQLLRGLKYVHSASVVHRDLKPSNLLINTSDWLLKIGDFGLAKTTDIGLLTPNVGSFRYLAPESQLYRLYSAASDIWSVGCIFGEMLLGRPLFESIGRRTSQHLGLVNELIGTPAAVLDENTRMQRFSDKFPTASLAALDMLEKMLVHDQNGRITAAEALRHPYLAMLHDINKEPVRLNPISFDFEQGSLSVDRSKELFWAECVKFNPDP